MRHTPLLLAVTASLLGGAAAHGGHHHAPDHLRRAAAAATSSARTNWQEEAAINSSTAECVPYTIPQTAALRARYPTGWITADLNYTGVTDYDKQVYADLEKNIPDIPVRQINANGSSFINTGYNSTDPDCWWSWSMCTTPKLAGLEPDVSKCDEPMSWGFTLDDGPNCSHNATNTQAFAELYYAKKVIKDILGITVRCWRPPYGDVDDRIRYIASQLDMTTQLWNRDTDDWDYANIGIAQVETNYQDFIAQGKNGTFKYNGAIVLTHELDNETMSLSEKYLPEIQSTFTGGVLPVAVCQNNTQPYIEQNNQYVYPNYAQWMAGTRTVSIAAPTAVSTDITLSFSTAASATGASGSATATGTGASGTSEALSVAVGELLELYPLLRCCVIDEKTRQPKYEVREVAVGEVLKVEASGSASVEELLERCLGEGPKMDVTKAPLWRVVLHQTDSGDRIALYANHVISDGGGLKALFGELLALISASPPKLSSSSTIPPTQESSYDMRPSYRFIAGVISNELVVPLLPFFLRSKPPPPFLPPPSTPPYLQCTCVTLNTFPASTVAALKATGKAHGVDTLHPLLHTCAIVALYLSHSSNISFTSTPATIGSITPMSLRDASLGHPTATGNFVSAFDHISHLTPSTTFTSLARSYASQLASPLVRQTAKWELGMMAWIPDPELKPDAERTGWEEFLEKKKDQERPFKREVEISNLGVLGECGWEGKGVDVDVAWAQSASPIGSNLGVNAISIKGGALTLSTVWREGAVPKDVAEGFQAKLQQVVEKVAGGIDEKVTVNSFV
ncbi:chitin deacetylase, carbohydrate esterase family 4 protein [Pseudohyphozyma bogoriensis]|nr:chitin deacetylase, carbohydrate esterase family 4 protein [Pseudohyphozyma bogoriensis]